MARPSRRIIASGIASWDADVDENFNKIFNAPLPVYEADTLVDLTTDFPPASYEQCLAVAGGVPYISDGTDWNTIIGQADAVTTSTATTVSEMVTDFNELLAALKTSNPPIMDS